MKKPTLIWVEQLSLAQDPDIPHKLLAQADVRTCPSITALDELVTSLSPAAIFFDFDYPDRRRLASFARVKTCFKAVPIVMMTLQHSESLAIWAFRQGALDYLVKPLDSVELHDCMDRIVRITKLQASQSRRVANVANTSIPGEVPRAVQSKKQKLSTAIYFVQKHYSERIYSDAMARLCRMSPTQFSRAFKQTFSVTFQEFILRYRVRQACKQLHGPNPSISEIAYNVGFTDPSYFARVFKRYVGTSPSDFASGVLDLPSSGVDSGQLTSGSQIVRQLAGDFDVYRATDLSEPAKKNALVMKSSV